MARKMVLIGQYVLGIILCIALACEILFTAKVIGYMNRGFEIRTAVEWSWDDVKSVIVSVHEPQSDFPEWYDGQVNDFITGWNWQK